MRFGRSSTAEDEDGGRKGLPIRLPMMNRKKQVGQDAKENVPPEDGNLHDSAISSPKTSKRQSVMNFFNKHKAGQKVDGESDHTNILTRMSTQRTKSSKSKHGRSSSSYAIGENALDRVLGPSKEQERKRASDNIFLQQQIRADSSNLSGTTHLPPFAMDSQADPNRTLTEEEVFVMFEGAPCFSVQEDGQGYRPDVVFHGGSAGSEANYKSDYKPLGEETFSACTLGVRKEREDEDIPFTSHIGIESKRTGAGDDILEMPSMLSANGLEPGTVGFEHFLQLPIADSLTGPEEAVTFERRHLLVSDPAELGLCPYDLANLVNRLTHAGSLYSRITEDFHEANNADPKNAPGDSVFGSLLSEDHVTTPNGNTPSVELEPEIDALQSVLESKGLWHDFGQVEWRIRIGQLLWTEADVIDDAVLLTERDVFILQVTLAAELLVRLKLLESFQPHPIVGDSLAKQRPRRRSRKLQWDLLLAEKFLTNLSISTLHVPGEKDAEKGIRSSFFSAISFFTSEDPQDLCGKPLLQPKNEDKQIAGLLKFAEALNWPHTKDVHEQLRPQMDAVGNERPVSMASIYATPLNSPRLFGLDSSPGTRTSYFGAMAKQQQSRPGTSRMTTTQSMQLRPAGDVPDGFNVGGWLSRSWLSGLVLPGEPSSHFLISTLLENSPQAIDTLGDNADLYGGFLYGGRAFWSKSSAVGRVIAASSGSVECMGWVSSPGASNGHSDGWVNIQVEDFPYPSSVQPRIKTHEAVTKASDPFHNASASQLRANNFTVPIDGPPVMGNEVLSHGLSFSDSDSVSANSSSTAKMTAYLTFSSPINAKIPHLSVPLTYDVHFISSHPCYPVPTDAANRHSFSSSPSETNPLSLHTTSTLDTPPPPAHPLHTAYRFMTLPVATLLSAGAAESKSRALSLPDQLAEQGSEEDEEVAVLDCRGKADLELLARAWCAKVGENAVVGKIGRTCLACCVREARGLGVRVVIRI